MKRSASRPEDVQMAPGVLGWSPPRGSITAPDELAAAIRAGEAVLHATSDHVVRAGDGDAPLVAVVRLDNDLAALLRRFTELALDVEDLRLRLLEIAEAAASTLSGG
jgi:hypothetical protein